MERVSLSKIILLMHWHVEFVSLMTHRSRMDSSGPQTFVLLDPFRGSRRPTENKGKVFKEWLIYSFLRYHLRNDIPFLDRNTISDCKDEEFS